jgi:UDP-2-acetamido-2,6-beta-L-arabino-hexul-4-ose reductase
MKTILITGTTGFIGRNLIEILTKNEYTLLLFKRETEDSTLIDYIQQADYIIHLAGTSRSEKVEHFYTDNSDLTKKIVDTLLQKKKHTPIFYTSSIHAELDNDFGKSKRIAEEYLISYAHTTKTPIYILRLTNTFGKWAKPNAHSVVATFCYNIANNLPITISDPEKELTLVYIDTVTQAIMEIIEKGEANNMQNTAPFFYTITKTYTKKLSDIAKTIETCSKGEKPVDDFSEKMFTTYNSYKN